MKAFKSKSENPCLEILRSQNLSDIPEDRIGLQNRKLNCLKVSKVKNLFFTISFLLVCIFSSAQSADGVPLIGQTKKVTYTVCRINVGWNGKSNINNVYAAPSGWQIVEFKDIPISKRQRTSYSFDLTPSNSAVLTTSIVDSKFNELLEFAGQAGKKDKYEGRINQMRSDYEKFYKKIISTHSQITTTGSVRGDGNWINRRPGRLYLDLEITLAYYPDTEEQFQRSIEVMKEMIRNDQ